MLAKNICWGECDRCLPCYPRRSTIRERGFYASWSNKNYYHKKLRLGFRVTTDWKSEKKQRSVKEILKTVARVTIYSNLLDNCKLKSQTKKKYVYNNYSFMWVHHMFRRFITIKCGSVSIICLYLLYWLFQVMVRLQTAMGAKGIRRSSHVARTLGPYMAARHSALQQVSSLAASCFGF